MSKLIVAVASLALAAPALAETGSPMLWHGIQAGMSGDEVRAAVPGATVDGSYFRASVPIAPDCTSDAESTLERDKSVPKGQPKVFRIRYVKVSGSCRVDDVEKALLAKYGTPVETHETSEVRSGYTAGFSRFNVLNATSTTYSKRYATWVFDGTTISFDRELGGDHIYYIWYSVAKPSDTEKTDVASF